jgi:hypothetical protein
MQEKKKTKRRSYARYGEKTVVRRVPVSVVPLLDCLLDKIKRLAKNDPRKTIAELSEAAAKISARESAQDKAEEKQLERFDVWGNPE